MAADKTPPEQTKQDREPCQTCGKPSEKYSSGMPECWSCWQWRKLDGPAARHWLKVSEEFLSNVDGHDIMSYLPKSVGLTKDEMSTMLQAAKKVRDRSLELINNKDARRGWKDEDDD